MPRSHPTWPTPELSCGSEILVTTRLGNTKRVWYGQGPVIERFEHDMYLELEAALKNVGIFSFEILFRVYMIGKAKEKSHPVLMVCCPDLSVAKAAKESLRDSAVMRRNPEFTLGSASNPLEGNAPPQQLAAGTDLEGLVTEAFGQDSEIEVFAAVEFPHIGRRLFVASHGGTDTHICSTGGVVLSISGRTYQLTVGHITDRPESSTSNAPHIPLASDAISYDGQSEGEEEDNSSNFERDMHRASMSFHERSEYDTSDGESEDSDSHTANGDLFSSTDYTSPNNDPVGLSLSSSDGKPAPAIKHIGQIQFHSRMGNNPQLDYTLVEIQRPNKSEGVVNSITVGPEASSNMLHIRLPAAIPRVETRVIAVTGSGGVVNGVLIPGTTFSAQPHQKLRRLYVVQLDGVVTEGDSGTVVVDRELGSVLGHIVSGCPGTRVAYIVSAMEVFADLASRLSTPISIEHPEGRDDPWRLDDSGSPKNTIPVHQIPSCTSPIHPQPDIFGRRDPSPVEARPNPELGRNNAGRLRNDDNSTTLDERICRCHSTMDSSIRRVWDPRFCSQRSRLCHGSLAQSLGLFRGEIGDDASFDFLNLLLSRAGLDNFSHEAEILGRYFGGLSLTGMNAPDAWRNASAALMDSPERVCWFHDSSSGRDLGSTKKKTMNSQELYEALTVPRFKPEQANTPQLGHSRRHIYIKNIDRKIIVALLSTVSVVEASGVISLLQKYSSQRASVGVTINARGYPQFRLECHLPYFALREGATIRRDTRRDLSGVYLRKSTDMPLLSGFGSNTYYLYESQVSFMVTGIDDRTWTAYCLVDTYFDAHQDELNTYSSDDSDGDSNDGGDNCEEEIGEDQVGGSWEWELDPLARGNFSITDTSPDPRRYFLDILTIRLCQVEKEWRNITDRLCEAAEQRFRMLSTSGSTEQTGSNLTIRDTSTIDVFHQLEQKLSATILQVEKFIAQHIGFFRDVEFLDKQKPLPTLWSVEDTLCDLKDIAGELQNMRLRWVGFSEQFKNKRASQAQSPSSNEASHFSRNITVIFLPILTSAIIFSTEPSTLPVRPSFPAFIILIAITSVIVWAIRVYRPAYGRRCKAGIQRWIINILAPDPVAPADTVELGGIRSLRS